MNRLSIFYLVSLIAVTALPLLVAGGGVGTCPYWSAMINTYYSTMYWITETADSDIPPVFLIPTSSLDTSPNKAQMFFRENTNVSKRYRIASPAWGTNYGCIFPAVNGVVEVANSLEDSLSGDCFTTTAPAKNGFWNITAKATTPVTYNIGATNGKGYICVNGYGTIFLSQATNGPCSWIERCCDQNGCD